MKQQNKIGLLAAAIVVGVVMVIGMTVGGVMLANGMGKKGIASKITQSFTSGESPLPPIDVTRLPRDETKIESQYFEYVRRHKWFAKSLSSSHLDAILMESIKANDGCVLWVSDKGEYAIDDWRHKSHGLYIAPNDFPEGKRIHYLLSGVSRPTKLQVVIGLSRALDAAEYRDGPGR